MRAELSFASLTGQELRSQEKKKDEESKEALEQKVAERMAQCLALVSDAEQIVKNTSRASSRALGYIALGEALWAHDRERGRGHLRHAFEAVSQVPLDESWPRREGAIPERNPIKLFPAIIKRIARLDPELAYDLTRNFGQTLEDGTIAFRKEEGIFRRDWALLDVASALMEQDPARASAIAAEVMDREASQSFVGVLFQLRRVDRTRADQLAAHVLELIIRRQPLNVVEFYALGSYVFPKTRLPFAVIDQESEKLPINAALAAKFLPVFLMVMQQVVQQGPRREFDPFFVAEAKRQGLEQELMKATMAGLPQRMSYRQWYEALSELRLYVPQYAPEIASVYEQLYAHVSQLLSETSRRAYDQFQQQMKDPSSESLDELVAQAQREPSPQLRKRRLAGAVNVAIKTKQVDRVEAILGQISDLEMRQNLSELYHFRAAEHQAGLRDMLEARRHAAAVKKPELMILAFAKIGETLQPSDAAEARGYLAEAERLLGALPDSAEKARAHLRLAAAYAPIEPAYASLITRTALIQMGKTNAQLDDLTGVTIKLDTIQGATAEKGNSRLGGSDLTATLDQLMTKLATEDFDGTLLTLAQVARGEVKLMAELVMVREGFRWIKQVSPKPEAAEKKAGTDEPLN
jgi:hypothetical protein